MGVLTTLINQHRGGHQHNQQSHDDDDNLSSSHYINNNNSSNCQNDNSNSYNKNKIKRKNSRSGSRSAFVSLIAVAVTILCVLITKCDANNSANTNNNNHNAQPTANLLDVRPVNYSVWNQNVTYLSSKAHNARGMGPLYNISNMIINLFVDDYEPIPRGKLNLKLSLILFKTRFPGWQCIIVFVDDQVQSSKPRKLFQ